MKKEISNKVKEIEAMSNLKVSENLFLGALLPFAAGLSQFSSINDPIFISGIVSFVLIISIAVMLKKASLKQLNNLKED